MLQSQSEGVDGLTLTVFRLVRQPDDEFIETEVVSYGRKLISGGTEDDDVDKEIGRTDGKGDLQPEQQGEEGRKYDDGVPEAKRVGEGRERGVDEAPEEHRCGGQEELE